MLTDIFAYRYLKYPIWSVFSESERRLLNQTIALTKDIFPCYSADGKKIEANEAKWKLLHDRLARELGVDELARRYYSYTNKGPMGQDWPVSGFFGWDYACEQFVKALPPGGLSSPDGFIKERLSFIELAMRLREEEVAQANARLPQTLIEAELRDRTPSSALRLPGSAVEGAKSWNKTLNATFQSQVDELNERFRRASAPLTYHNGFVQVSLDQTIEQHVARPFWRLVADPIWRNVDIDMKEALDRRDSNDKDPALFAAKALESAIKIVSDAKSWTRGNENGAAAYIDNLMSKNNGSFVAVWEGEMLKEYFRKVRNSLGHGPGSEPMPALSPAQTDWAIETAMSWVRTLVRRM
jgi:hypothetical protein